MTPQSPYEQFISRKQQEGSNEGFAPLWMPSFPFDFQQLWIDWTLRKGKSLLAADCGMGKTIAELVWGENVARKTNRPVLHLTPLAVAGQIAEEAEKFGIEARRSSGKVYPGINIANYEKLHLFDPNDFAGCVCDESSAIKAFDGKRRVQVTEFMRRLRYRLLATATAAPNDYIELGTSSEALGVMGQMDMLNRFFRNDNNTSDMRRMVRHSPAEGGPQSAGWRFKGHAETPFWRWCCSWMRAGRKPSDFGTFTDERFVLTELIEREHVVETRTLGDGYLFAIPASNMHEERDERRRTIQERCEMAASLVADTREPFVVWCHLNDEGNLLERMLRGQAVQVSGADSDEAKEESYAAFSRGQIRGIVTKPKIGAWGLNWQHCAHVVTFASHSYEQYYQAVRRCWRFGQTRNVVVDLVATEGERGARENMRRKSEAADRMFSMLVAHMHEAQRIETGNKFTQEMELPRWVV
jgi:hypothetical protein